MDHLGANLDLELDDLGPEVSLVGPWAPSFLCLTLRRISFRQSLLRYIATLREQQMEGIRALCEERTQHESSLRSSQILVERLQASERETALARREIRILSERYVNCAQLEMAPTMLAAEVEGESPRVMGAEGRGTGKKVPSSNSTSSGGGSKKDSTRPRMRASPQSSVSPSVGRTRVKHPTVASPTTRSHVGSGSGKPPRSPTETTHTTKLVSKITTPGSKKPAGGQLAVPEEVLIERWHESWRCIRERLDEAATSPQYYPHPMAVPPPSPDTELTHRRPRSKSRDYTSSCRTRGSSMVQCCGRCGLTPRLFGLWRRCASLTLRP